MTIRKIGLFLGSGPSDGGTYQYNLSLLDALVSLPKSEFETVVACISDDWSGILRQKGVRYRKVGYGTVGRVLRKVWLKAGLPLEPWRKIAAWGHALGRALVSEKADLWVFPSQDQWSYEFPVPSLVAVHDLMHRYERQFPEVSANGEFERREAHYSRMGRWARGILVDAEVGRTQFNESYGTGLERIHVLPYIAPSYIQQTGVPSGFDERYRLPAKYFFYPAQFWDHKNHLRLIRAVAELKSEGIEAHLVLAGSVKAGYPAVQALVAELGLANQVRFLGYVPNEDMPELYRRARGLVMPTFFGPTNIPPLEAFALGCPVAFSGIYGMFEQLGDAALFFNPKSVAEIAGAMKRLWQDDELCRVLAERGKKRHLAWGPPEFGRRFEAIVRAVAGAPA